MSNCNDQDFFHAQCLTVGRCDLESDGQGFSKVSCIHGEIVRAAKACGMEVPVNEMLFRLVKMMEAGVKEFQANEKEER